LRSGVVGLLAGGLLAGGLLGAGCGGSDEASAPVTPSISTSVSTSVSPSISPSVSPSTGPATTKPGGSPTAGGRSGPPEPSAVGDTSADGLWGRAAEVVCADQAKQGTPPADRAAAATWVRDRAWAAVSRLEAVPGNGEQGKELRDILYAIGTQSDVLATVYRTGNGDAASLERARADAAARLGRFAAALKAPSCASLVDLG
jgi:hypothetical protein